MGDLFFNIVCFFIVLYIIFFIVKTACKNAIRDHLPEIKAYIKMVERNEEINKNQK